MDTKSKAYEEMCQQVADWSDRHGFSLGATAELGNLLEKFHLTQCQEVKRLREALQDIDKLEVRRMYESCPDCYSESLGCSETKVCAQFKGRTLIQEVIDKALKDKQ